TASPGSPSATSGVTRSTPLSRGRPTMPIPLTALRALRRHRRRWFLTAAIGPALALALTAALPAGTAAASASRPEAQANLPVTYNFLAGVAAALANPSA